MVSFRLEWLGGRLGPPVARLDLDCRDHQLGCGVVLVRPNQKARDDLGLPALPHSYPRRSHPFLALDLAGIGGKGALAVWQSRHLPAGGSDAGRDLVHMVGANSSWTFLVECDHA